MKQPSDALMQSLLRLAQLQHEQVDRLALQQASSAAAQAGPARAQLEVVAAQLHLAPPEWLAQPDPACVPALVHQEGTGWGVLVGTNGRGQWVSQWWDDATQLWIERAGDAAGPVARMRLGTQAPDRRVGPLIRQLLLEQKSAVRDAAIGGIAINLVALAISLFSMQVYDRVIPTSALQTLLVLTLGVCAAIGFELLAKGERAHAFERLASHLDEQLARATYLRFLALRLDQLPPSVGALAAQLRGYEAVRAFITAMTSTLLVDAPFALLFALTIALIAGKLALLPLAFLLLVLALGGFYRRRIDALAARAAAVSHRKSGLLVETVEGAEVIKAGQGGWRMLARWLALNDAARTGEQQMRAMTERAQHLSAAFQQLAYVLMVGGGALLVGQGELSMGGLIACSILSGRVLAPIAMVPQQLLQWAHCKAALRGLDALWALQDDHHGQGQSLQPAQLQGRFVCEAARFDYAGRRALEVDGLRRAPGEKVGVLGPVGAGKSTLLRLLSGMYRPTQGRILLDGLDLAQIAKPVLAEHIAYVPQDGRLFAGSLRENLILGQIDPGDKAIIAAARQSGLFEAVIASHPDGLQQPIFEGGSGLSGGQRQLVNLTRALLRGARIWLLDEPTAAMDRKLEQQVVHALGQAIGAQDSLVLVTHKAELLCLVDRLIVVAGQRIVLDGPKDEVLRRLSQGQQGQQGQQDTERAA